MRRWKTVAALALAAGLVAITPAMAGADPGGAARPGAPAAGGAQAGAAAAGGKPVTVTLITGDRVTMLGSGAVTVQPGAGRQHVAFQTVDTGGRLRVIPTDAYPLLAAGRLDPRLFDITALTESGADGRLPGTPLILTYGAGAAGPAARARVATAGTRVVRDLPDLHAVAVRTAGGDGGAFWSTLTGPRPALGRAGSVSKVWLDGRARVALDVSVPQIGAPAAWQAGYTGAGVKVAVLDTGIDDTHPDLAGQVAARANFTDEPDGLDHFGHGTHVASTIASTGGGDGRHKGVAPGATLLDGKVCDGFGFCSDSSILAGMQWAADSGARVVNMSLGSEDTAEQDPMEAAVDTLTAEHGMLFVVSAGNDGHDRTVESPASADAAVAVGAVSKAEALAPFSSRGPRVGDSALKPDISAPGVDITAARGKDSPGTGQYVTESGTSMAAPHVTGSAAILAGEHPDWTPAAIKAALMGSARPNPRIQVNAQGAGRVDVAHAITQSLLADPPSVSFGRQEWPHTDDRPDTRRVRYDNRSGAPVTLRLTVDPAGSSVFSVSPDTLTIPAGGSGAATVTVDTRAAVPDGFVGGYLTATGNGPAVSTPLLVEKEVESYNLTLRYTSRDGTPATSYDTLLIGLDQPFGDAFIELPGGESTRTLRLMRGRWEVNTNLVETSSNSSLIQPALDLTSDQTLDVDARLARPITLVPPKRDAAMLLREIVYRRQWADGSVTAGGILSFEGTAEFTAQLGPNRTYDHIFTKVGGQWAARNTDGSTDDSPWTYRLSWFQGGRYPTGFTRVVTDNRSLAAIRTSYRVHVAGASIAAGSFAEAPGQPTRSYLVQARFHTPFVATEYVNTDGGIRWRREMDELAPNGDGISEVISAAAPYRAGHEYREVWNTGVFGPALPADGLGNPDRTGDKISTPFALFADGSGRRGAAAVDIRTAIYRDGTLLEEEPFIPSGFTVPAQAATYRLEAQAK
ncbi:MAG: hypothetical protein V7637_4566, partial [Mycobacteriales bacterium]